MTRRTILERSIRHGGDTLHLSLHRSGELVLSRLILGRSGFTWGEEIWVTSPVKANTPPRILKKLLDLAVEMIMTARPSMFFFSGGDPKLHRLYSRLASILARRTGYRYAGATDAYFMFFRK